MSNPRPPRAPVINLREARLEKHIETIAQVIALLREAGLDDGKPILVQTERGLHMLLFGAVRE